jgi:hypothetical protein
MIECLEGEGVAVESPQPPRLLAYGAEEADESAKADFVVLQRRVSNPA